MKPVLAILIVATILMVLRIFAGPIRARLLRLRVKLRMVSLRHAIHEADDDKAKTQRKNLVVHKHDGFFETVQKKQMKQLSAATKNKSNKAMTPGRRKMMPKNPKQRLFDPERIREIEKKSLYVTN